MTKRIRLTQGKFAIVDDDDFEELNKYMWFAHDPNRGKFYAVRNMRHPNFTKNLRQTSVKMHRQILGLGYGDKLHADHINGNTLDNRKSNLRAATPIENSVNRCISINSTSGYKGVNWHPGTGKWRARCGVDGKRISLGLYVTQKEAYKAYCKAAKELHGEFARIK